MATNLLVHMLGGKVEKGKVHEFGKSQFRILHPINF